MERELFALFIEAIDAMPQARRRPPKARYTDRDIVLVWLWAVLHDRPIDWACRREHWPWHDRKRGLPSGSTMSRRLRDPAIETLVLAVLDALRVPVEADHDGEAPAFIIDGKPLTVSGNSADRDAGFGRACGVMGKGYKLHQIIDMAQNTVVFAVFPLNVSEQTVAMELIEQLGERVASTGDGAPPTVLADGNYDTNNLYEAAAAHGLRWLAAWRRPWSKGLGHRRHSEHRVRAIALQCADRSVLAPRRRIESSFGTLGNVVGGLGPLPNAVRGLPRVRRWVAGKLVIAAIHRVRRRRQAAA